jgi:Domain of unknown function (DUF4386)
MTTNTLGEIKVKNQSADTSQSNAARIAGLGLLIMALLAFFANFFVLENLVIPDDAAKTVSNILANEMLFRLGIAGFLLVLICDMLVAWALHIFFKPANQNLSLLAAIFRLVYTAIFAVALFPLTNILQLLGSSEIFTTNELQTQVMVSLESFQSGWQIGLLFFGCHLLMLGYIVVKSGYVPKILGIFLLVAGFAYTLDSFAHFLLHNYADYENLFLLLVAPSAIIGELSLCFWLLIKGTRFRARAFESINV